MNKKTFIVGAMYKGYDLEFDLKLNSVVKRLACGGGFGFGQRDITWSFKTKNAALKAASRLKKLKGVSVAIDEYDD